MKLKKCCKMLLLIEACFILNACNSGKPQEFIDKKPKENAHKITQRNVFFLDEASAIMLAEKTLVKVYGEKVLKQRPWIVTDNISTFRIKGTFHFLGRRYGGVADITIRKSDGKVLHCTHGR